MVAVLFSSAVLFISLSCSLNLCRWSAIFFCGNDNTEARTAAANADDTLETEDGGSRKSPSSGMVVSSNCKTIVLLALGEKI